MLPFSKRQMAQLGTTPSKTRASPSSWKSVSVPWSKSQVLSRALPGGLEEIARRDEDQLAARRQVAHALLDEVQVQVGVAVEQARMQVQARAGLDVARLDVGRVADDGVELFRLG
jgi:hypothetical protein